MWDNIKAFATAAWCIYKIFGMWYLAMWGMLFMHDTGDSGPISFLFGDEYTMNLKATSLDYYGTMAFWFNLDLVAIATIAILGGLLFNKMKG